MDQWISGCPNEDDVYSRCTCPVPVPVSVPVPVPVPVPAPHPGPAQSYLVRRINQVGLSCSPLSPSGPSRILPRSGSPHSVMIGRVYPPTVGTLASPPQMMVTGNRSPVESLLSGCFFFSLCFFVFCSGVACPLSVRSTQW